MSEASFSKIMNEVQGRFAFAGPEAAGQTAIAATLAARTRKIKYPAFAHFASCGDREVPFIVSAHSARGLLDPKPHENHKLRVSFLNPKFATDLAAE